MVFPEVALQSGENVLTVKGNGAEDTISLYGVEEHDAAYDLPDLLSAMQVGNWFVEQDEQEDYGEDGYHSEMKMSEMLKNERCMELVKGWAMSLTRLDIGTRFKFVSMLISYRDNENYKDWRLRDTQTCRTNMIEEDYEALNKLLRSVKRV